MSTITATVQLRRDTAANWTANNPTLLAGEVGFETDTKRAKLGDGVTAWNSLAYIDPSWLLNDSVTNAKLANMAEATIKGRQAGSGTGDPEDLTASQARTALGLGTAALVNTGTGSGNVPTIAQADVRYDLATNTVRGRIASDFTTSSATYVDVAPSGVNFEVTLEANSTYWFYFYGIYQSTNAATGIGLSFTFSNSPTVISLFTTRVANTNQAGTTTVPSLITASDGGNIANSVIDINTNLPNFARGLVVTGANASVVRCRIARGGSANNVTIKAGSIILAHKIA